MTIVNLRTRFELAVARVVKESFGQGIEDVAWWVGLNELDFGECDHCGETIFRPVARIHLNIYDRHTDRLSEVNGDLPTMMTPADIREATRQLINGWRIASLEDDLSESEHRHGHFESELDQGD